jgi:hypothetical protein
MPRCRAESGLNQTNIDTKVSLRLTFFTNSIESGDLAKAEFAPYFLPALTVAFFFAASRTAITLFDDTP